MMGNAGKLEMGINDENGEYGMTEWAYAIADEPSKLPLIKKAMESKKFVDLCKGMKFTLDKYDAKFRKNGKKYYG